MIRSRLRTSVGFALAAIVTLSGVQYAAQNPAQLCPPCEAISEAQGAADDLPADVLADRAWALGNAGIAQDEWQKRRKPGYLLGTSSTIVQIDTGVVEHPLLPKLAGGHGVDFNGANGIFGPGYSNRDPLLAGFLRFPGHGTKTSSVIAGVAAAQFKFADDKMNLRGAAPGARLIPVRGTQGVVLIPGQLGELETEPWRVALVLNQAAAVPNSTVFGNVPIDVISMSLGGWPPAQGLCEAVKNATDKGVIVIAAAGNEVRRTKFPADCPTAIAVAGSTYEQRPWSGSAGSAKVDVAAPAEGVWTASVVGGAHCIEASSGTSFATALVASMAAEWVAFHRESGTLPNGAARVEAFRAALKKSARPWQGPDAKSWASKFGSGIADLGRLMAQ